MLSNPKILIRKDLAEPIYQTVDFSVQVKEGIIFCAYTSCKSHIELCFYTKPNSGIITITKIYNYFFNDL